MTNTPRSRWLKHTFLLVLSAGKSKTRYWWTQGLVRTLPESEASLSLFPLDPTWYNDWGWGIGGALLPHSTKHSFHTEKFWSPHLTDPKGPILTPPPQGLGFQHESDEFTTFREWNYFKIGISPIIIPKESHLTRNGNLHWNAQPTSRFYTFSRTWIT